MAERAQASMRHKISSRTQRILALVPKPKAPSDIDDSGSSEDEICHHRPQHDSDSSIAPSIPASLENLQISSESEDETNVISISTTTQPNIMNTLNMRRQSVSSSTFIAPESPSVLQGMSFSPTSELITSLQVTPSSFFGTPSPSNIINFSSLPIPSPSAATRSKKGTVTIKKTIVKMKKIDVKWNRRKFQGKVEIQDKIISKSSQILSPLQYFNLFFSDDLFELIVRETNLYHMQEKGVPFNMTIEDLKKFIAIQLLMGIVPMPAYTDYWSKDFRYTKISQIMTLKQYQKIRRYLHFSDKQRDDGDRYYKVRPLLEKIRLNCLKIEEETRFSIDEMMVPYKGTRAGTRRQYIKNKPRKWGFKIFVRAGVSGIVHDFLVYGGEDTFRYNVFTDNENCMGLGAKVVIALSKTIQQPTCSVLYFDNFFTSLELIHYLRDEYGIFSLGTIKQNRLRGAETKLLSDKNLKKKGRGAHTQVVCNDKKIAIVKWFDNKCVTVASTYVDDEPIHQVLRFNKIKKSREPVPCPNIIRQYNAHMGGVDLADMLIALYRTEMRAHRWYIPLFSQMLDICVNNAWLLYRRDCSDSKLLKLKEFRSAISNGLITMNSVLENENLPGSFRHVNPSYRCESRYDQVGHMPSFTTKGRCKNCAKGQTKFFCIKCNVRLCLVEDRNCFSEYHKKQ